MFVSKKAGRRRVSVIATISTYLQRETCFTDWRNIIMSELEKATMKLYSNQAASLSAVIGTFNTLASSHCQFSFNSF